MSATSLWALLGGRLKQAKSKGHETRGKVAKKLNRKLWGGFSRYALRELEELKNCSSAQPIERSKAAWYLARWYAFKHNYAQALDYVVFSRVINPSAIPKKDQRLLEIDCLLRIGDVQEARTIINQELMGHDPDFYLAYANSYLGKDGASVGPDSDAMRLAWINRIYEERGLLLLAMADPSRPLAIDNLSTTFGSIKIQDGPKVSIIIPAYNAENSIPFALRGLIAQTWQNLEIIVVDDCSLDETFATAKSFAAQDPRVIALRQQKNQGAYIARNRGLEIATGQLITTHDANDWSHPQKIEKQVFHFSENPTLQFNYSLWARASYNLRFSVLAFRTSQLMVHGSMVSTLFRSEAFDHGAWDTVRFGADREFIDRVRHNFNQPRLSEAVSSIPLSFSLDEAGSLTRNRLTHAVTGRHGVRREYHESASHWRASNEKLVLRIDNRCRTFPVPGYMLPDKQAFSECDVLFVMDFNSDGSPFSSLMNYVDAAITQGLNVAVFQWRNYTAEIREPLKPTIRQMAQVGKLRVVAPGEKVRASTVIVGSPIILQHVVDLCPDIQFDNFIVIVDEVAEGRFDPEVARENLKELFGTEGTWVPVSEDVRRRMLADSRYPAPPDTWTSLIDTAVLCGKRQRRD